MPITEAPPKVPLEQRRLRPDLPQDPAELHLLIDELEDERYKSRWRESVWISVILHLLLIIGIILQPRLFPELFPKDKVVLLEPDMKDRDINYLALPQDQQKTVQPPKTSILSDKNRVAQARQPTIDRHTLEELQNARRPGPPAPKGMQAPAPQPSVAQAAPQGQQQQAQPAQKPPENTNSMAKLEQPEQEKPTNRNVFSTAGSAGSAIQQAARAAAQGHGGQGGEYGLQLSPNSSAKSDIDVLTDTLGVDFGPYLSRIIEEIRQSWYGLMPESVIYPPHIKGKVTLQFIIQKDGSVAGLRYVEPSGDIALDRPAYGSITANNPFPPLPKDFVDRGGSILGLRIRYYYNPDKGDLLR